MTSTGMTVDAFLCDGVQAVGGKLYALGIGWNLINTAALPAQHSRIGIGMLIHVPYTATNQNHKFVVQINSEDGGVVPLATAAEGSDPRVVENGRVVRLGGEFNVGRPPELTHGDEQIVPLAVHLDMVEFEQPGLYSVMVLVDGSEAARLPFRIRQVPQITYGG